MLCGEYAVTIGIEALALPVRKGQWMDVWEFDSPSEDHLVWNAIDCNGDHWLNETFQLPIHESNEECSGERGVLLSMLKQVPSNFWAARSSYRIETQLEFEQNSGLGSSSTLIANFSHWTGLDAQRLQQSVFGGSGYDIALAELGKPLIFWIEKEQANWAPWTLHENLTSNWHLVFLGKKQNSRSSLVEVKHRLQKTQTDDFLMQQLKHVANAVKMAQEIAMLEAGLEMWQAVLSMALGLKTPYQQFEILPIKGGLCKWLGAWGGDMLLVNKTFIRKNAVFLENYTVVSWNEWVINE